MSTNVNACPFCDSYNISNNRCEDCGKNIKEKKQFAKEKYSDIQSIKSPINNIVEKSKLNTFIIKKGSVYDENENKICSVKRGFSLSGRGNKKLTTSIGKLDLHKEQPDIIELHDLDENKIGQLVMKEKDLFTFETQGKSYKMDRIGNLPFNVYDSDSEVVLTIVDNPEGFSRKLGIPYPSYKIHSLGKLDPTLIMLLGIFINDFYVFLYSLKPTSVYSYTVKRQMGLKFYDIQGNLFARTAGFSKILWIIGFVTMFIFIGFFILLYLAIKTNKSGKLISFNGSLIGTYNSKVGSKTVEFNIPSQSWSGSLSFDKYLFGSNLSRATGTVATSDGNYIFKMLTIIQDENQNNLCTIYGYSNNFVFIIGDKFDSQKGCLLSAILINKFLIPKNTGA